MSIRRIEHILTACILIVLCFSCSNEDKEKKIDETYTLAAEDKRPFGGYTFRYLADFAFVDDYIYDNPKTFDEWHNAFLSDEEERTKNLYILVSPTLPTYKDEVLAMTDFVERGNT